MPSKHDFAIQPCLLPMHGGVDKKPRMLERDVTTVGRARGCDIGLDSPDVSTIHCLIYRGRDGLRLRDCGSRTGTRVNGMPVKIHAMNDGDIVQIGPFSFTVHIPPGCSVEQKAPDLQKLGRWDRSRRNLVRLGLNLRRRLRRFMTDPAGAARHDLDQKAADLRAKIRHYDQRVTQLEEAERDLEKDRERLHQEIEAHKTHVEQVEGELAGRLDGVDQEIRAKWVAFQQRLHAEEREHEQLELMKLQEHRTAADACAQAENEKKRAALEQAEAGLRGQRDELAQMMAELRELQDAIQLHQSVDNQAQKESGPRIPAKPMSKSEEDLEGFENELNRYQQQLLQDRAKLNAEVDQMRARKKELEDTTRETELEMSRERAELARERIRIDRMRDEIRTEFERMQREAKARDSLAPVQKLREELLLKKQPAEALRERQKTF